MISKSKQKYINSLQLKKNRRQEGLFVAEGPKVVGDLMAVAQPKMVVSTNFWLASHKKDLTPQTEIIEVNEKELSHTSFLQHPQQVLALYPIPPQVSSFDINYFEQHLCLALDGIQDPGNLGTIIRIADWFGIETILCSHDTVDAWSPKVVQATMGSIARVNISYVDLQQLFASLPKDFPVYGTLLDGNDIYEQPLSSSGIIVMGNEGNGISANIKQMVNRHLLIPNFPKGRATADSLNVAIATAITCAEFRRRDTMTNTVGNDK